MSWFFRRSRLKNLLAEVERQIIRFGGAAAQVIEREQRAAIDIAVKQAQETFNLEISQNPDSANLPDARDFASTLNPRTVETAVGAMGDGSPLTEYFEKQLAPTVAAKIKSEVIRAAALGTDFKTIARNLEQAGDIAKHRALSVARTEVNRVRREATRSIYEENDDIIEGWEWVAAKSSRTCPACLALDGQIFDVSEPFPQHINCRCTLIPVIEDLPRRPRTLGAEWFERQPDDVKEEILGKEAFAQWKQSRKEKSVNFELRHFVQERSDKRFGKSLSKAGGQKAIENREKEINGGIEWIAKKSDKLRFYPLNVPDSEAASLARRLNGAAGVAIEGFGNREFDVVTRLYVGQTTNTPNVAVNPDNYLKKQRRNQIKITMEAAKATGRIALFEFTQGKPSPKIIDYLEEKSKKIGVKYVII
jgi:SPP1 gp7 family putative phage head morphogenesis protein